MNFIVRVLISSCCLLTACSSVTKPKSSAPVIVRISLYSYPIFSNSFEDVHPVKNEKRLKMLMTQKPCMDLSMDIRKGLPVSAFSKQVKRQAATVDALKAGKVTHVWYDGFLDYLPPNFFNRVGWIDWYLVRRDVSGKMILLLKQHRGGLFGHQYLLRHAKPGDQIIGAWGC
jgi:hypothetical protein